MRTVPRVAGTVVVFALCAACSGGDGDQARPPQTDAVGPTTTVRPAAPPAPTLPTSTSTLPRIGTPEYQTLVRDQVCAEVRDLRVSAGDEMQRMTFLVDAMQKAQLLGDLEYQNLHGLAASSPGSALLLLFLKCQGP